MGTLAAAKNSEISVVDYPIQRLDQKYFRVRLRSALDEVDLGSRSCKAFKHVLFVGAFSDADESRALGRVQLAYAKLLGAGSSCTAVVAHLAETDG